MTPKLTPLMVAEVVGFGNGCAVAHFADTLDEESREAFVDAINISHDKLPAIRLRDLLTDAGFTDVPTITQIKFHRTRTRSCKCPPS